MNVATFAGWARVCFFAALALMALAIGGSVLMLGHHIAFTLAKVDRVLDGASATMDAVNRPCGGKQACGTLADVAKTLNTIRQTAAQAELAAAHENTQLDRLDGQERQLYADLHSAMIGAQTLEGSLTDASDNLNRDLVTLNTTIAGAQPVLEQSSLMVGHADATLGHVDALVEDPAIGRFMSSSADTALQVDGTATDVRRVADKVSGEFLNPPPKHWWNYAGKVWYMAWQAAMLAK